MTFYWMPKWFPLWLRAWGGRMILRHEHRNLRREAREDAENWKGRSLR